MRKGLLLLMVVGLGAVVLACGGTTPEAAPAQIPQTAPVPEPAVARSGPTTIQTPAQEALAEPVSLGLGLFRTKGVCCMPWTEC